MKCCSFLSLMHPANDGVDGKAGSEVEAERERERKRGLGGGMCGGDSCLPNHWLPSLSAIPTANYLLMSSLSRVDSLHHRHYHLVDEH